MTIAFYAFLAFLATLALYIAATATVKFNLAHTAMLDNMVASERLARIEAARTEHN